MKKPKQFLSLGNSCSAAQLRMHQNNIESVEEQSTLMPSIDKRLSISENSLNDISVLHTSRKRHNIVSMEESNTSTFNTNNNKTVESNLERDSPLRTEKDRVTSVGAGALNNFSAKSVKVDYNRSASKYKHFPLNPSESELVVVVSCKSKQISKTVKLCQSVQTGDIDMGSHVCQSDFDVNSTNELDRVRHLYCGNSFTSKESPQDLSNVVSASKSSSYLHKAVNSVQNSPVIVNPIQSRNNLLANIPILNNNSFVPGSNSVLTPNSNRLFVNVPNFIPRQINNSVTTTNSDPKSMANSPISITNSQNQSNSLVPVNCTPKPATNSPVYFVVNNDLHRNNPAVNNVANSIAHSSGTNVDIGRSNTTSQCTVNPSVSFSNNVLILNNTVSSKSVHNSLEMNLYHSNILHGLSNPSFSNAGQVSLSNSNPLSVTVGQGPPVISSGTVDLTNHTTSNSSATNPSLPVTRMVDNIQQTSNFPFGLPHLILSLGNNMNIDSYRCNNPFSVPVHGVQLNNAPSVRGSCGNNNVVSMSTDSTVQSYVVSNHSPNISSNLSHFSSDYSLSDANQQNNSNVISQVTNSIKTVNRINITIPSIPSVPKDIPPDIHCNTYAQSKKSLFNGIDNCSSDSLTLTADNATQSFLHNLIDKQELQKSQECQTDPVCALNQRVLPASNKTNEKNTGVSRDENSSVVVIVDSSDEETCTEEDPLGSTDQCKASSRMVLSGVPSELVIKKVQSLASSRVLFNNFLFDDNPIADSENSTHNIEDDDKPIVFSSPASPDFIEDIEQTSLPIKTIPLYPKSDVDLPSPIYINDSSCSSSPSDGDITDTACKPAFPAVTEETKPVCNDSTSLVSSGDFSNNVSTPGIKHEIICSSSESSCDQFNDIKSVKFSEVSQSLTKINKNTLADDRLVCIGGFNDIDIKPKFIGLNQSIFKESSKITLDKITIKNENIGVEVKESVNKDSRIRGSMDSSDSVNKISEGIDKKEDSWHVEHREKPYTCPHCGFSVAMEGNLELHIKAFHSDSGQNKDSGADRNLLIKNGRNAQLLNSHSVTITLKKIKKTKPSPDNSNKNNLKNRIKKTLKIKQNKFSSVNNRLKTDLSKDYRNESADESQEAASEASATNVNVPDFTLRCFTCSFETSDTSSYYKHIQLFHELYSCFKCSFVIDNKFDLNRHHKIHRKKKCLKCSAVMSFSEFKTHMSTLHPVIHGLKCTFCKFSTNSQWKLKNHTEREHKEKETPANKTAGSDIKSSINLRRSSRKRSQDFVDDNCATRLSKRCSLKCAFCNFRATSEKAIIEHQNTFHITPSQPFSCKHCLYVGKNYSDLSGHRFKEHRELFVFNCVECKYRSSLKSAVIRHIQNSHNEKAESLIKCFEAKILNSFLNTEASETDERRAVESEATVKARINKVTVSKKTVEPTSNNTSRVLHCNYCVFKCNSNLALMKHKFSRHRGKYQNKCKYKNCPVRTRGVDDMKKHYIAHKNNRHLRYCSFCSFRTRKQSLMKKHKQMCLPSHSRNKASKSVKEDGEVQLPFYTPRLILNTESEDPNDSNYYHCESCNYKSESVFEYRIHTARTHRGCFRCKQCSLFCSSVNDRFVHDRKAHRSDLKSKCRYCCFYDVKKEVERHEGDHSLIRCYYCEFSSHSILVFNRHILKSHPNKEPSSCHKCGYQTTSVARLKEHLVKLHFKVQCNLCDHSEPSMLDMRKHKIDMHPEKCYRCKKCPFKTINRSSNKNHRENPAFHDFTCEECDYQGESPKDIARHTFKSHYTNYHRFCIVCSFKASSRGSLLRHELNNHLGRIYRCTKCLFYCFDIGQLNDHFTDNHKRKTTADASVK